MMMLSTDRDVWHRTVLFNCAPFYEGKSSRVRTATGTPWRICDAAHQPCRGLHVYMYRLAVQIPRKVSHTAIVTIDTIVTPASTFKHTNVYTARCIFCPQQHMTLQTNFMKCQKERVT